MMNIIVLCTANVCRSVIARELLNRRLADRKVRARVRSAGMLDSGEPAAPEVVRVLGAVGIDASAHRSRRMTDADLRSADLVLAMAREHLRYAVVLSPEIWPRAFTLKEIIRRAQAAGPRAAGQSMPDYLAGMHRTRRRIDLLGDDAADDVTDPAGGPSEGIVAMAAQLDALLDQLVALAWSREASQ